MAMGLNRRFCFASAEQWRAMFMLCRVFYLSISLLYRTSHTHEQEMMRSPLLN